MALRRSPERAGTGGLLSEVSVPRLSHASRRVRLCVPSTCKMHMPAHLRSPCPAVWATPPPLGWPGPGTPCQVHPAMCIPPCPAAPLPLQVGPQDETYNEYPELSIHDWHKKHGLYVE